MSTNKLSSKFDIDNKLIIEDIQEAAKKHRFIKKENIEDFINKYK